MNNSERVNLNSPTIPAFFVRWVIPRKVKRQLYEAGIGRHTADEIWHIGRQNIDALSTFIGTRIFFGGGGYFCNEEICQVWQTREMVMPKKFWIN